MKASPAGRYRLAFVFYARGIAHSLHPGVSLRLSSSSNRQRVQYPSPLFTPA